MNVRLRLPLTPCRQCQAQALLADAWGRWASPAFLVTDAVPGARELVCVHCAKRHPDPSRLAPLTAQGSGFVPEAGAPLSEPELFDLLCDLGAVQVEETDALSRGDVGGGLW